MLIIPENIWKQIEHLIPQKKSAVGRPQKDRKLTLSAIFYLLKEGCSWHGLPDYYGKPTTIHGRFRQWIKDGVFNEIFFTSIKSAISKYGEPECFYTDTTSIKAPHANFGGKNPTDRKKNGVKKSIVCDKNRVVLSLLISSANTHDVNLLIPHLENLTQYVKTNNPKVMITDSAWDSEKIRSALAKENIALLAATNPRRDKHKKKYSPSGRWVIEQIFGILHWKRGIKFCWTKTKESFLSLSLLACSAYNFQL
ncbi:IS5 family transposase [bacterium]|nr:IS5 family transposase [bacterium]